MAKWPSDPAAVSYGMADSKTRTLGFSTMKTSLITKFTVSAMRVSRGSIK
jgi:hypothetical protein